MARTRTSYYNKNFIAQQDLRLQEYYLENGIGQDILTPFDLRKFFKVYHDGSHYVASLSIPSSKERHVNRKEKTELDKAFDFIYFSGIKQGFYGKELFNYIKSEIVDTYALIVDTKELDEYIVQRIKVKLNNFHKKKKRFLRKANLNKWNYFVTLTYDDKLHTEESFRAKLRKTLSNFHTRRDWRYMGVFEYSPETHRLHFHALMYIPVGEMVGKIEELKDYSTTQHKMQVSHSSTFFAKKFGRNDFKPVYNISSSVNYILKYLQKSGENIIYSRGIPNEIIMELKNSDIACSFTDFVTKYVLFDDVIDWEEDIQYYDEKQLSFLRECG